MAANGIPGDTIRSLCSYVWSCEMAYKQSCNCMEVVYGVFTLSYQLTGLRKKSLKDQKITKKYFFQSKNLFFTICSVVRTPPNMALLLAHQYKKLDFMAEITVSGEFSKIWKFQKIFFLQGQSNIDKKLFWNTSSQRPL